MKILYVLNPLLSDYKKSGSAMVAMNLINEMCKRGNDVSVIANDIIKECIDKRCKVYNGEQVNKMTDIADLIHDLYDKEKYDLVHIHIHQSSFINVIAYKIRRDIPIVFTNHSKHTRSRMNLNVTDGAIEISDKCDNILVVVPSYSMIQSWNEFVGLDKNYKCKNIRVVRNGIINHGFNNEKIYDIITCGGIDKDKRITEVLQFVNKFNIKSLIIGSKREGSLKSKNKVDEYYEDFIKNLNNSPDSVKYEPAMDNIDVIKNISKSKIYFGTSVKESFALTIAESLSVGTPVLCTYESAVCELLDDTCSVVIPKEETRGKRINSRLDIYKKYYDKLIKKIENNEITRESVINRFNGLGITVKDMADNYMKVYNELVGDVA